MVSKVDYAWMAGMIDGDGSIMLVKSAKWRTPVITIDSTDIEILEYVKSVFGGAKLVAKKKAQPHHRQAYTWRMYGADRIISFLREVEPYMRCEVKKQRARLIITEFKLATPRNGRYSPDQAIVKAAFEERFLDIGEGRGATNRKK